MHVKLLGWVSAQEPVFPLGKVFVPQTVVWYKFLVNFFLEKQRREKQGLRWTLLPTQGGSMDFRVS